MMFKFILPSVLLSASVFAAPSPGGPLRVSISAPTTSVSSRDFIVSATVSNPTTEDIRVVKFNTVLDDSPTRNFHLFKDDQEVSFSGFRVSPDLNDEASFSVIPAGESVTVVHNLAGRFDFGASGAGTYVVQAESLFQYGANADRVANLEVNDVSVEVTEVESVFSVQQSTPTCSDAGRLSQLQGSLTEARALAGGAASDVRSHPSSGAANSYFGGGSRDTIWYNLDRIAGDLASSGTRVLACVDTHNVCASNSGIVAYTWLVTSGSSIISSDIFGCNAFFGAPATSAICSGSGTSTRGSIMLHELSHAVFLSKDTVYGCSGSAALGDGDKIQNADNYACYGVQTYLDYNC